MEDEVLKESIYKKFKDKIKENIKITEKGKEKAKFEIVHFSEVYNIPKGRVKMNLTKKDKEWITSAIVACIKPLEVKIESVDDKLNNFMKEQKVFNNKQEIFNNKQELFNRNHKH